MNVRISMFILLLALVTSCSPSTEQQLALLSGYWEIASVQTKEGLTKEYGISSNIDFIEVNNKKGIRKKLQPDLSGNFKTNKASENIDISITDDIVTLKYSTPFDSWTEKIVKISDQELILENDQGTRYHYRRYTPLLID